MSHTNDAWDKTQRQGLSLLQRVSLFASKRVSAISLRNKVIVLHECCRTCILCLGQIRATLCIQRGLRMLLKGGILSLLSLQCLLHLRTQQESPRTPSWSIRCRPPLTMLTPRDRQRRGVRGQDQRGLLTRRKKLDLILALYDPLDLAEPHDKLGALLPMVSKQFVVCSCIRTSCSSRDSRLSSPDIPGGN